MSDASYTQVTGKLDCNKCVWGTRDGGCASWECEFIDRDDAVKAWRNMPSAQPEIIRCKDCRWWDKSEDSQFGYCMAMKHGYISANWEIGIYRRYKGDWYCADAERRTDE